MRKDLLENIATNSTFAHRILVEMAPHAFLMITPSRARVHQDSRAPHARKTSMSAAQVLFVANSVNASIHQVHTSVSASWATLELIARRSTFHVSPTNAWTEARVTRTSTRSRTRARVPWDSRAKTANTTWTIVAGICVRTEPRVKTGSTHTPVCVHLNGQARIAIKTWTNAHYDLMFVTTARRASIL